MMPSKMIVIMRKVRSWSWVSVYKVCWCLERRVNTAQSINLPAEITADRSIEWLIWNSQIITFRYFILSFQIQFHLNIYSLIHIFKKRTAGCVWLGNSYLILLMTILVSNCRGQLPGAPPVTTQPLNANAAAAAAAASAAAAAASAN